MVHKKWFWNPDEHYLGEILYVTSGSKLPSRIAFRLFHLYWFNAQKEIPCSFHLDLMSRTFQVLHIPGQNSSKLTTTHTLVHILGLPKSWISSLKWINSFSSKYGKHQLSVAIESIISWKNFALSIIEDS